MTCPLFYLRPTEHIYNMRAGKQGREKGRDEGTVKEGKTKELKEEKDRLENWGRMMNSSILVR